MKDLVFASDFCLPLRVDLNEGKIKVESDWPVNRDAESNSLESWSEGFEVGVDGDGVIFEDGKLRRRRGEKGHGNGKKSAAGEFRLRCL